MAFNKRINSDVTYCPIFCLKDNDAKKRPTCSAAYAGVREHDMIERAFQVFGKESFQNGIFYRQENCIRLGLSDDGVESKSYIKMFTVALERATRIIELAFEKSEKVSICYAFPGDSMISNLSSFRDLKSMGLSIPNDYGIFREWVEDDEWNRNYLFFQINKSELHKCIFGVLGAELGIEPSCGFDLYLYDEQAGILVNPYDDRGLDIVGLTKEPIKRIYDAFPECHLKYDYIIHKMEACF